MIALANTSADPIAALNAAAGFTVSDPVYLASIGYTGLVVNPVTGMATPVDTLLQAQAHGWESLAPEANAPAGAQFQDSMGTYFNADGEVIGQATHGVAYQPPSNFTPVAGQGPAGSAYVDQAGTYYNSAGQELSTGGPMSAGPAPYAPPGATELPGGFQNTWEMQTANNSGFATRAEWAHAQDFGITNATDYQAALANGTIPPANTIATTLPTGATGYYDPATGTVYNANGTINTAATSGAPTAGAGTQVASAETPFRVDVSGTAGFQGNPSAVTGPLSEGSQLATQAEIDAGTATYNPAANAWEVAGTPAELSPIVPTEIPAGASTIAPGVDLTAGTVAPEVATLASSVPAEVLATANATADPLASLIEQMGWTPGATAAAAGTAALASGAGGAGGAGAVEAVAPVTASPVVAPPAELPPLSPVEPVAVTPSQPIPEVVAPPATTPPVDYTGPGIGEVPNPAEVPVTDLSRPAVPMGPSPYDWVAPAAGGVAAGVIGAGLLGGGGGAAPAGPGSPANPPKFGKLGALANPGLNPGWIQAQPFYNTTSPVQSQYYWGNHPYAYDQADRANYNNVPYAPAVPWGVQQAQAPFDVNQFIRSTINPQSQAAAAGSAPEYYAPYAPATPYVGGKV
jgi:hypothetical protein